MLIEMALHLLYITLTLAQATQPPSPGGPDSLYTGILSQHLHNGLVDYTTLCTDGRLGAYIHTLSSTDPAKLADRNAELAFWINAYNAYTLEIVCSHYPVESIVDIGFGGLILGHVLGTTVWDEESIKINGVAMNLNHIEHEIIRPVFRDPRIHFALVCAAMSCPTLREEPYNGETIDEQLDDQGRRFLNDPQRNSFDRSTRVAHLSRIFDWYANDFGANDEEILRFIAQYLPQPLARDIEGQADTWTIEYNAYDWSLNGTPINQRPSH